MINLVLYNYNEVKGNLGQIGKNIIFIHGEKFCVGDKIEYSRIGEPIKYSTVIVQDSNGIYPLGNINVVENPENYSITKHEYCPLYYPGDIILTNAPNSIENTILVVGD